MTSIVPSITETDRLMASVGVGQWTWDGHNNKLTMDPTCKGFFEISWEEKATEEAVTSRIHEDDLEKYQSCIKECQDGGTFFCEFRVRLGSGGIRYLSGRGHTVEQEGSYYVIKGVFIDVTQAKNLERQLNRTRSRMQDLVDGIPGLFSYIDADYHVQFMSSQYREIFGRDSNQELVGIHIKDLIGEEMFAERKPRYDEAMKGEIVHSEADRVMPDGSHRFFTVTHQPHIDASGSALGVITLGIDITERREMEEQVEAKSEELARSNKDLEQFAYVASHDLKAPLRAIEVLVEWLKDDLEGHDEGDVQENLELLGTRTSRLARLLDDLLAYSRAGRKVGDVRDVNLKTFVEDVAALIAPPAGFKITADDSLDIVVPAHHAPLETVLRNLMNNAIKHHPNPEKGLIHVYGKDQGDSVMFGVLDNGAGIPEEYSEKIFKMFQTLQPRDEREGSGMGLAIVKRIIDWQRGRIWYGAGPEGKGTVFKFTWNKRPADMPELTSEENEEVSEEGESNERHAHETG